MRNKKFRMSQCLSPAEILAKVRRQMQRQKQYQKTEENLMYLNNSFSNNIQLQEIFIDICKGKKKNIKSKQMKAMYAIFSDNKANLCIFQKIANDELQRIKQIKQTKSMNQSSMSKWANQSRGLAQIIEQDQTQSQRNFKTIKNLQNQIESQSNVSQSGRKKKNEKKQEARSSINSRQSQAEAEQDREVIFLMKRIYCRIIQKMLVKIAFYTLNNKFLDCIAMNMLQITKNLQTIIRRLTNIKDLRLLQQIIIKVYRQNLILESKIYQMLVDGGYIISIDEFYRVNGIDVAHKDVFQRNVSTDNDDRKKKKLTLKEKIRKLKEKHQKQNVVKKDHIDRINNEINDKYLICIQKMRQVVKTTEEKPQDQNKTMQLNKSSQNSPKKLSIFSKTQPISKSAFSSPKPSRFSRFEKLSEVDEVMSRRNSEQSQKSSISQVLEGTLKKKNSRKSFLNLNTRMSTFSPEFSKLIKSHSNSQNKIHRNSIAMSQKFMKFNQFQKKQRKQSKTHSQGQEGQNQRQKYLTSIMKKKKSQNFQTFAINKLLKLYQSRNTDRFSVDDFLGTSLRLPQDVKQSLKQDLMKLKFMYDPESKRSSNKSSFQMYGSLDKKNSQRVQSAQGSLSPKYEASEQEDFTDRTLQHKNKNNRVRFSSPQAGIKNRFSNRYQLGQKYQKLPMPQHLQEDCQENNQNPLPQNVDDLIVVQKQFCLVRLAKNRSHDFKAAQRITSTNNSLFTINGVQNVIANQITNQIVPLRNQKLKRISYVKIKDKLNESGMVDENRTQISQKIRKFQSSKLFKKAYQSQHMPHKFQNLNLGIQGIVEKNQKKKLQAIKIKNRNSLSVSNKEIQVEKPLQFGDRQRQMRYQTFYPRFLNKQKIQNKVQSIVERTRKFNTCHIKRRSEQIFITNGLQRQSQQNKDIFQVYDIHKRIKIPK